MMKTDSFTYSRLAYMALNSQLMLVTHYSLWLSDFIISSNEVEALPRVLTAGSGSVTSFVIGDQANLGPVSDLYPRRRGNCPMGHPSNCSIGCINYRAVPSWIRNIFTLLLFSVSLLPAVDSRTVVVCERALLSFCTHSKLHSKLHSSHS
jgi:hypothetical protein